MLLDETKLVTPYSRCTSEALTHKGVDPNALIKAISTRATAAGGACKHWVNICIEE